ncbi:MAG: hypothetical protein H0X51_07725 [Parachlamydiaceae bacterium]|nr:hypothetical protein [Parachlamydiaceae bacterium]
MLAALAVIAGSYYVYVNKIQPYITPRPGIDPHMCEKTIWNRDGTKKISLVEYNQTGYSQFAILLNKIREVFSKMPCCRQQVSFNYEKENILALITAKDLTKMSLVDKWGDTNISEIIYKKTGYHIEYVSVSSQTVVESMIPQQKVDQQKNQEFDDLEAAIMAEYPDMAD